MIDTKEQYEKQMEVIEEYLGTPGVDARETIEALREVVRDAKQVAALWAQLDAVYPSYDEQRMLNESLDALPDWLTE